MRRFMPCLFKKSADRGKSVRRSTRLRIIPLEDRCLPASFQGLGDLPGGNFGSYATGVSADGSVVVGASYSASGREAFRWTAAGGMVGLGDLPGGGFESAAWGVSGDGSVVVGYSNSATMNNSEAFRWTAAGGMVGMGFPPGAGMYMSQASGVSADGSVIVGGSGSTSSAVGDQAFRWTAAGGMVGLGDLPGGSIQSTANAVSPDGSVVVGQSYSSSGFEAFRWTAAGGMVGLGDLPGGRFESDALAVSADGSVVVGQGISASGREAFRWTAAGGMVGLGDLPGGNFYSVASDVSADGSVVVGGATTGSALGNDEAFRWTAAEGMRSLRDILVKDYGLGNQLAGWILNIAVGCSADGRVIVGTGTDPAGNEEAWIARLDPPDPVQFGFALTAPPVGTGGSEAYALAADPAGNTVVTGAYQGTVDFDPGPGQALRSSTNGTRDIYVAKYSPAGGLLWVQTFAGPGGSDYGFGIDLDNSGNVYVAGMFTATVDFDPGPGVESRTSSGNEDAFALKLDSGGGLLWVATFGGPGMDSARAISAHAGEAYVTGEFEGSVDFDFGPGAAVRTAAGSQDAFLVAIGTLGQYRWDRPMGGPGADWGLGVAFDEFNGSAVTTGYFDGTANFRPVGDGLTPGVLTSAGQHDVFVTRHQYDGLLQSALRFGGAADDIGWAVATDGQSNAYVAGSFQQTVNFGTAGANNLTAQGVDAFLLRLDPAANATWARQVTGAGDQYGRAVSVGADGQLYTVGDFTGTAEFNPGGPSRTRTSAGQEDVYVARYSPGGTLSWAASMGGAGSDKGFGVGADANQGAYTTGFFNGTADFDPGPGQVLLGPPGGMFLSKLVPSGPPQSGPPQAVYVDASWAGTPNGADPDGAGPATAFGYDAFATIQAGVNAVAAGGTVNVLNGSFAENLNLSKANVTVQVPASGGSPVVINPAAGDAVTVSAGGVTVSGNNRLTVTGNSALGRNGVLVSAAGATLQGLTVTGFSGAGSYGVSVSGAGASARLLSDTISGSATGVRVSGGAAVLQGDTLADDTTQGATSAGLLVQSGGRVDAGGGDGAGLGAASSGGNTFSGYAPGGALAIVNLNTFQAAPDAAGAVSTMTGNVAAKNNAFAGAADYARVEALVFHRPDSPFSAYADYRNASGGAGALPAPAADPASFRFLAAGTSRSDPLAAAQRSVIQGISFQFNGPVALNAGQTLANLLSVVRESPAGTPGYAAGSLPASNTALALSAFDLANSSIILDGTTGLTTVTVRLLNTGAYAGGGSAAMTEYGSLIDGIYRANVNGASASLLFAGSGTAAGTTQRRFHRLFGDTDNTGELDAADFSAIRNYLSSPASPFRPYLDFNLSGGPDTADTTAFNARLGSSLIE